MTPETLGRATRQLVDRAGVQIDSPTHAFRRTVATVMYENGVRTRVIERIMGWAPRLMHERHYLRVADKPMREAIEQLYRDDPISPRQTPRATANHHPLSICRSNSLSSSNSSANSVSAAAAVTRGKPTASWSGSNSGACLKLCCTNRC
jgi:Phage integrase family